MPLVRTDVQAGRTPAELRRTADVVQEVMLESLPPGSAGRPGTRSSPCTVGQTSVEDSGLGLEGTDGVNPVQILQQGRSQEQEERARAEPALRLEAESGIRPADLIVSVNENAIVDRSFGLNRTRSGTGER